MVAFLGAIPVYASGLVKKNILVLNSYHKGYKWTDDITRGIEDVFRKEMDHVYLSFEYMDTKRVFNSRYIVQLVEIYRHKYQNAKFDAIISSDDNAFEFLKTYRDDLFPETPVVFCGVNYFKDVHLKGHRLFSGVNEKADIRAGLEVALGLHPDARKVYIVNDTTTTGQKLHAELLDITSEFQGRAQFVLLEDLAMETLQQTLQELAPGSIVYYTFFFRDSGGRFFEYDESIRKIAETCPVPVYGAWDFSLGFGIMGGMLASGYYQGETAARIASRILDGEAIDEIPVVKDSPNRYMFDFHQLERFGIKVSQLPAGSIVINQPSTFYAKHKKLFWSVTGVIIGLALVIFILAFNIWERKKAEKMLKWANESLRELIKNEQELRHDAQAASQVKTKFLNNVSHELRTPMNAIIGMNLLLQRTGLDNTQAKYLRHISESSNNLLHIIEDLLDFSELSTGELRLEKAAFRLDAVVGVLTDTFANKKIGFCIDIPAELPNALIGDSRRLQHVLVNLLDNAVKFSGETPNVTLGISKESETKGKVTLAFSVRDDGVGISPDHMDRLFLEPFTQGDDSSTRKHGGLGLGLCVCKSLVEMMDGSIWVESTPGNGSTFYFTAKFGRQAEEIPFTPPPDVKKFHDCG